MLERFDVDDYSVGHPGRSMHGTQETWAPRVGGGAKAGKAGTKRSRSWSVEDGLVEIEGCGRERFEGRCDQGEGSFELYDGFI